MEKMNYIAFKIKNPFSGLGIICFIAILCLIQFSSEAMADPIPPDLIPPDVTLSPKAIQKRTSVNPKIKNKPAPGMAGANQVKTRATYGNNPNYQATGITKGNSPQAPPKGAGVYTGLNTGANSGANAQANKSPQSPDPVCVVDTNKGKITIRLFQQYAPNTVKAFISMVNEGFYNGLTWHRHEPGFVIQGGCPKGNGTGLYIDPKTNQPRMLFLESSQKLRHNAPGVVAMAHFPKNPHSASCQFYITLGKKPNLDFKYTIFGGVIDGMDTVFRITKGDQIKSITMAK